MAVTSRTVEDTLRIRRFVEDQKPKTAVLAGGGFIGLEMAENLVEMGVSVTIVQRPKQLLAPLDADMASFVHAEMRRHGVALRLGETVTGFRQDGDAATNTKPESGFFCQMRIRGNTDGQQHHIRMQWLTFFQQLDADMASFVHAEMRRHGVALRVGETVTGFRPDR